MLCEKPMATNVEGCVRIADAVKKAGIIFAMGHGRFITGTQFENMAYA